MIFKYEVCYQREFGMAYEASSYSTYEKALIAYNQRIKSGCREVAVYNQATEKFIVRYDEFRSERSLLKWGLLNNY